MMRRLLIALLLAAPAAAEPAMWVVRDADTEITLFGTVHELPTDIAWLTPRIAARFDAADTIVIETIVPDDPVTFPILLRDMGRQPGLKPLADRVPARRDAIVRTAAELGLPIATLDGMKTWLAALTFSSVAISRLGITPANGVEARLTVRAKAAAKPLIGLETPAQQLGFFNGLPDADQAALLGVVLDQLPTQAADTRDLLKAWTAGDADKIAADDELHATPVLEKLLLADRNARWADWIAGVMKRPGKVFIAVGAAHLAGASSVQAMLAKRGLVAERVR